MFAGQAPDYINKHIFGGKGEISGSKNFLGGLLGGAIGGAAGFAGGLATGGIGGALAGFGTGALSGVKSGAKGNTVSDLFKAGKGARTDAKALGTSLAERGGGSGLRGLRNTIAGAAGTAVGMREMYDRHLADLDRQSKALDDLDAAEKFAVKDSKMGAKDKETGEYKSDFDKDWIQKKPDFFNGYSDGYQDVKLGEDKDSYAAQMTQYDKEYQKAMSDYDSLQSGESANAVELSEAAAAYSNFQGLYSEYEENQNAINDISLSDAMGKKFEGLDGSEITVTDQASFEQMKNAATARNEDKYKDAIAAHDRYTTAEEARRKELSDAKSAVQNAKYEAEQKAKEYYDERKKHEGEKSADVQAKREYYEKTAKHAKKLHKEGYEVSSAGQDRSDQKRSIYEAKAAIMNSPGYANTHGQKPKS